MPTTHTERVAEPRHTRRLEGGRRLDGASADRGVAALTIVTVAFNARVALATSVDSVRALSRPDVSYIVVDGGSHDGTVEFLKSCGDAIDYWVSEPDRGIYNAMNKAVGMVTPGSFVLFLGAGDTILKLPDATTLAAAQTDGIQILYGDVLIGDTLFRSSFSPKLRYRNTLHHQGLFVRRGVTAEPWFDESLKVFSDWDLNLSLYRRGVLARRLDYTVAYAEPDGISAKLHLGEIARMIARRCGSLWSLAAIIYHGGLHLIRSHAAVPDRSRQ